MHGSANEGSEKWLVRFPLMMAPNEFYFFASEKYVYRLTPLGPHGQEMLGSFELFDE